MSIAFALISDRIMHEMAYTITRRFSDLMVANYMVEIYAIEVYVIWSLCEAIILRIEKKNFIASFVINFIIYERIHELML